MVDIKEEHDGSEPGSVRDEPDSDQGAEHVMVRSIITEPTHLSVVGATPLYRGINHPPLAGSQIRRLSDNWGVSQWSNAGTDGSWVGATVVGGELSQGLVEVYPAGFPESAITLTVLATPVILSPTGMQSSRNITVTGGTTRTPVFDVRTLSVVLYRSFSSTPIGSSRVSATGDWSIPLTMDGDVMYLYAKQFLGGAAGNSSPLFKIEALAIPSISTPRQGENVVDRRPTISGKGTPNSKVTVRQTDTGRVLVTNALVGADLKWSKASEVELTAGTIKLKARATFGELTSGDSTERTFTVGLKTPQITSPAPRSLQETTFVMGGG